MEYFLGVIGPRDSWTTRILESVAREHNFNLQTPLGKYPKEILDLILYGYTVRILTEYNIQIDLVKKEYMMLNMRV